MLAKTFTGKLMRSGDTILDLPIAVSLAYDPDGDPLAVRMLIQREDDVVEWHFARDLMARGMTSDQPVGSGDVRIRYWKLLDESEWAVICLENPHGHADIGIPHEVAVDFLEKSAELVDFGDEDLGDDIDYAIEEILNG